MLMSIAFFKVEAAELKHPEHPIKEQVDNTIFFDDDYKFQLKDHNGEDINIADLKGKVVFINFWATWCPPCVAEMPDINSLYQNYKDEDDVVFVMVSLDNSFDKAKDFLDRKEFDFTIYEPQSDIPKDFQSRGIPNTFVLDKEGEIAFSKMGMGQWDTRKFRKFLDDLRG